MNLHPSSSEEILREIAKDLRSASSRDAILIAAACEQLRALVALEAMDVEHSGTYPVSTVRLTQPLAARIGSIWPSFGTDETTSALEELKHLSLIGDLEKAGNKWYLTPLRRIRINESKSLLAGGVPLRLLPLNIRSEVEVVGRARIHKGSEKNRNALADIPFQRLEDWLDVSYSDVVAWASAFKKIKLRQAHSTREVDDAAAI